LGVLSIYDFPGVVSHPSKLPGIMMKIPDTITKLPGTITKIPSYILKLPAPWIQSANSVEKRNG
jgi:hypothetical protein